MRVFVAVDLAIRVVENLVLLQEDLNGPISDLEGSVRWIEAANIHLTLKFLGDADPGLVIRLREVLREAACSVSLFDLETVGTGCFPDEKRPRVLWAGTGEGLDELNGLRAAVLKGTQSLGIADDKRPYQAHVTLGRVKTFDDRIDVSGVLAPFEQTSFGRSQIKDLLLMESRLDPKGATYHVIERFPLNV